MAGVQSDNTVARPTESKTVSKLDTTAILRNLADRIDSDGLEVDGVYELLSQVQNNTNGVNPNQQSVTVDSTGAITKTMLINCPAGSRIAIRSVVASAAGATNFKFTDEDDVDVLASLHLNANAAVVAPPQGIVLPEGKPLFYTVSAAVAFGLQVNFQLIEVL